MDTQAQKQSCNLGPLPLMEWIDLDGLVVDHTYQRELGEKSISRINRIVSEFNWRDFQPLTVTPVDEDGNFAIVDGQHRFEAAKRHPEVTEVPCYIITAPGVVDQAKAFVNVNKNRLGVSGPALYYAQLAAGDPDALHIAQICERSGIKIARNTKKVRKTPGFTIAIHSIKDALKNFGDRPTCNALDAIMLAHPETPGTLKGKLILALAGFYFYHQDDPAFNEERMIPALERVDIKMLENSAQAYREIHGGTVRDALRMAFVKIYNDTPGHKLGREVPHGAG